MFASNCFAKPKENRENKDEGKLWTFKNELNNKLKEVKNQLYIDAINVETAKLEFNKFIV